MLVAEPLILPEDVLIVPVADLAPEARRKLQSDLGRFAVTRPRSRAPSMVVDEGAADLLQMFRSASAINDVILRYSRARQLDPEEVLEGVFPILSGCIASQFLVPANTPEADRILPILNLDSHVGPFELIRCVQVFEDTEVYQVKTRAGSLAALKLSRSKGVATRRLLEREAAILNRLDGTTTPAVVGAGAVHDHPYLAIEWRSGVSALVAAHEYRNDPPKYRSDLLMRLCHGVLRAYEHVHRQGVVHADVHPGNIMIGPDGRVTLLDFGLARADDGPPQWRTAPRGGVAPFYEPEFANARLAGGTLPQATFVGEQYVLAALLYLLLTGHHYVDFSLTADEAFAQIARQNPLPFSVQGVPPWPDVERVLSAALAKEPRARFPTVQAFAAALRGAMDAAAPIAPGPSPARRSPTDVLLDRVARKLDPAAKPYARGLQAPPQASITYGASGLAIAAYRLACIRSDPRALAVADAWHTRAVNDMRSSRAFYNAAIGVTREIVGETSPYHTASGVHAAGVLIGVLRGDVAAVHESVRGFVSASEPLADRIDLTLGRAGTLLACSLLLDALPPEFADERTLMMHLGGRTARTIRESLASHGPIPECVQLRSLGMAHGWAGVLFSLLRWYRVSSAGPPPEFEAWLSELAAQGELAGRGMRWRMRTEGPDLDHRSYMNGWCNGSAGHLYLWTLAHRMFGVDEHAALAEQVAWNVWEERGSIPTLCCGLGGQAYALLKYYQHTGDRRWLVKAQHLASMAAEECLKEQAVPWEPYRMSLFKGEVGVAVLAADISRPEGASMPFFDEEGWS